MPLLRALTALGLTVELPSVFEVCSTPRAATPAPIDATAASSKDGG